MNDARRQLLHESFKLIDLSIMVVAFALAVLASSSTSTTVVSPSETFLAVETGASPQAPDSQADLQAPGSRAASPDTVAGPPIAARPVVEEDPSSSAIETVLRAVKPWLTIPNVVLVFVMLFVWHATFNSRGLYSSRRLESPLVEALDVVRAGFLGSMVIAVITGTAVEQKFQELAGVHLDMARFGIVFFVVAIGITIVARLLIRHILIQARLRGRNLRGVLIVGTNHRAIRFAKEIESKPELGYYVVGFVDEEWDGIAGFKKAGGRLVSNLKDLGQYMANHVVDEVVVALPVSSAYIYSSRIVSLCQEQGITVRFISQIFDSRLARGRLDVFEGEPMLSLEGVAEERFGKLFKALLDRSVAAVLLVGLLPLFAVVSALIKLTSPGPVFFVQTRIGLNKRPFPLYKFRTMVPDAEAKLREIEHLNEVTGPVFKIEKDPRVTTIGELLRKSSIDELPQLWNVLKGDMSLVGPRPLPERDYAGFDQDSHRRRLSVRPGLTCTWQVSGRNSIPFERWMEMDLEYIDEWSLWLDFKILLQTIPVVLGPLFFLQKGEFVKGKEAAVAEGGQGS